MAKTKPVTIEALEAIRQEIASLKAKRESIASARCNEQDLSARVEQIVSGWAGQVDADALGQWIASPEHKASEDLMALATPMAPGQSKVAAIASYLMPEAVKASLMAAAKPWVDRGALPVTERAEAIATLELEQFGLEVEEEAIITRLEEAGVECYRRPDVDPAIVLGLHAFED